MDIKIHNEGTIVGFAPLSEHGQEWMDANLQAEPWQLIGHTLWVDHRLAQPIIDGMTEDGLALC